MKFHTKRLRIWVFDTLLNSRFYLIIHSLEDFYCILNEILRNLLINKYM